MLRWLAAGALAAGVLVAVPPAQAHGGHYCGHGTHETATNRRDAWVYSEDYYGRHRHLIAYEYRSWRTFWQWRTSGYDYRFC